MIRIALLAGLTAFALQACPPDPLPPDAGPDAGPTPVVVDASPPPPASDASAPSVALCAHLAALGCQEGIAANCATVVDHVQAERLADLHVACLMAAQTKAASRACRSVACP